MPLFLVPSPHPVSSRNRHVICRRFSAPLVLHHAKSKVLLLLLFRLSIEEHGIGSVLIIIMTFLLPQSPERVQPQFVSGGCDKQVRIHTLTDGGEWRSDSLGQHDDQHDDIVRDVAWAPSTTLSTSMIASCCQAGEVRIWVRSDRDAWVCNCLTRVLVALVSNCIARVRNLTHAWPTPDLYLAHA